MRPASRSPGRHPRTLSPGERATRCASRPTSTAPRSSTGPDSSQRRSCSRTAWTPPPRSTRRRAGRSVEQLGERRRHRPPLVERAQQVLARGRVDALEQRQDLVADQAAHRVARSSSRSRQLEAARRQYASVSSRHTQRSGRTTPSSRRTLIPVGVPLDDEPVEDRLDLVGERVAGRAQAARLLERVAQVAQLGLGRARARAGRPRRRSARRTSARPRPTRRRAGRGRRAAPRRRSRARASAWKRQVESAPPETRQSTSPPGAISSCRRTCASIRSEQLQADSVTASSDTSHPSARSSGRASSSTRARVLADGCTRGTCGRRRPAGAPSASRARPYSVNIERK